MDALRKASSCIGQAEDEDDGGAAEARTAIDESTLGVLSDEDIEGAVHDILGSSLRVSPRPPRLAMENMVEVDEDIMSFLGASGISEDTLSYVEHIVETENISAAATAKGGSFAARVFRQRPGVVYAVR